MTHAIDVSKGSLNGTVSRQWASRPDDQKFLSLGSLRSQVSTWADESAVTEFRPGEARIITDLHDPNMLKIGVGDAEMELTNYAFDTICGLAGAPPRYMTKLPAPLAGINLRYGLASAEQNHQAAYIRTPGEEAQPKGLRGITSTRYGRIFDRDVVDTVMKIAGEGTGDTRWKVPGTIEWGNAHGIAYNPEVDITKENTTLYASDRDIFLFLVDDKNPIEVGKLDNGEPDLMFRGFYVWNSEVGARTFGVATMYLRGVCQNRNLWGVEGFNEVIFKHTSGAPERFLTDAAPSLASFAEGAESKLIAGVKAAKMKVVAKDAEERLEFLQRFGFSKKKAEECLTIALMEEGHDATTLWDFGQAVSAMARRERTQERRLLMEAVAGDILNRVKL